MAKKRKSRSSQSSQEEQVPVEDPTVSDIVVNEELQHENEQPQNLDENKENNEQGDEDLQEEEEEEDGEEEEEVEVEEEEEEEEGDEQATENDVKQVKIESNGGGGITEDLSEEPVEKLLEPFTKEQLVVLLKEAISKYPDIVESVEKIADADPAHRKIFVHGLGWDTTTETLISEYKKYGEIEDCKAVVDKVSGKSKGYGFILFKHRSGARKALKEPQKKIGNRITSCQLASAGPVPAPPPTAPPVSEYTQRKIFVSNVSAEIDPQKLREFFSKFGEIEDGPLGMDKQTGKPRGFALFVYKSIESAKKALEEPHKNFEGHNLNCQKAVDGVKMGKGFHPQQQQHQHHNNQYGGGHHHHHPSKKAKFSMGGGGGGGAGQGHLMAPSGPAVGFNPPVPPPAALGQVLTAFLASQGAGLGGIGNLLGGLAAPANPQGMPPVNNSGYGNQGGVSYQQGGYPNPQMGQGGSRPPQGGASYMGHGH